MVVNDILEKVDKISKALFNQSSSNTEFTQHTQIKPLFVKLINFLS